MELLGIIFIIAIWDCARTALKRAGSDYAKSRDKAVKAGKKAAGGELPSSRQRSIRRHHAIGYWAGEAGRLFPSARTGWHTGWLAHRTALDQRRAHREAVRTEHLEQKASALGTVRDLRQRQAEAQKEIDGHIAAWNDLVPSVPVQGRKAVREAGDELARKRSEKEQADGDAPPLPSDGVGVTPLGPYAPTRRPDGKAETEADKRFFDERESGYDGPLDQDGRRPDMSNPDDRRDAEILQHMRDKAENEPGPDAASWPPEDWPAGIRHRRNGDAPPPTGGNAVTTGTAETTYDQSVDLAQKHAQVAEADTATVSARKKELENLAEAMQAAEVDPATLGAVADQIDRYDAAEKAIAACQDGAAAIVQHLQRGHAGLAEAHQSAPVAAAHRDYYAG